MQVMQQPENFGIVLANTLPDLGLMLAGNPIAVGDDVETLRVNFGLAARADAERVLEAVRDVLSQAVKKYAEIEVAEVPDEELPRTIGLSMSTLKMAHELTIPKNLGLNFSS